MEENTRRSNEISKEHFYSKRRNTRGVLARILNWVASGNNIIGVLLSGKSGFFLIKMDTQLITSDFGAVPLDPTWAVPKAAPWATSYELSFLQFSFQGARRADNLNWGSLLYVRTGRLDEPVHKRNESCFSAELRAVLEGWPVFS